GFPEPANLKSNEERLLKLSWEFETRSTTGSKKFQGRFLRYQCRSQFARYFGRYVENDERKNLGERLWGREWDVAVDDAGAVVPP
ncbi:hypothetical protein K0M31_013082, partial [Melipona bicolor]